MPNASMCLYKKRKGSSPNAPLSEEERGKKKIPGWKKGRRGKKKGIHCLFKKTPTSKTSLSSGERGRDKEGGIHHTEKGR